MPFRRRHADCSAAESCLQRRSAARTRLACRHASSRRRHAVVAHTSASVGFCLTMPDSFPQAAQVQPPQRPLCSFFMLLYLCVQMMTPAARSAASDGAAFRVIATNITMPHSVKRGKCRQRPCPPRCVRYVADKECQARQHMRQMPHYATRAAARLYAASVCFAYILIAQRSPARERRYHRFDAIFINSVCHCCRLRYTRRFLLFRR